MAVQDDTTARWEKRSKCLSQARLDRAMPVIERLYRRRQGTPDLLREVELLTPPEMLPHLRLIALVCRPGALQICNGVGEHSHVLYEAWADSPNRYYGCLLIPVGDDLEPL